MGMLCPSGMGAQRAQLQQEPLWDSTAGQELPVPEHCEAVEENTRPGAQGELSQGPAGQNETPAPAARREGAVGNETGQHQGWEGLGQNGMGAVQTGNEALHQGSDWGDVLDKPQPTP